MNKEQQIAYNLEPCFVTQGTRNAYTIWNGVYWVSKSSREQWERCSEADFNSAELLPNY
jgi:hypothetical protein